MTPALKTNTTLTIDELSNHSQRVRSGSINDGTETSMTIFVVDHKASSSSHWLFGVGNCDTVSSLKHKIADRRGIPLEQQRLVFGGQQLEDDCKLSDYKIRAQSCIHLDA